MFGEGMDGMDTCALRCAIRNHRLALWVGLDWIGLDWIEGLGSFVGFGGLLVTEGTAVNG